MHVCMPISPSQICEEHERGCMLQVCKAACLLRMCIAFSTPARTGSVRCNAEAEGGTCCGGGSWSGAHDGCSRHLGPRQHHAGRRAAHSSRRRAQALHIAASTMRSHVDGQWDCQNTKSNAWHLTHPLGTLRHSYYQERSTSPLC